MKNRPFVLSKIRCPVCRLELERWYEEDDYRSGTRTIKYRCPKCDYERTKYEKFQK